MKRITIGITLIFLIVGAIFFLLAPAPATAAILYIDSGDVQVDTGKGWIAGTDEMELDQGAKIKTGQGQATIVMLEGEVINLQPNSEIELKEISKKKITISQLTGETLNKVSKISGITEYTVETPTTVATVRGTEFAVSTEKLEVSDGEVEYFKKEEPQKKIRVKKLKRALALDLKEEEMTEKQIERFEKFKENYIKKLERVREREVKKHKFLLKRAEKRNYSEQKIKQMLQEADEGKRELEDVYKEIPRPLRPKFERTYKISKEIRKENVQKEKRMVVKECIQEYKETGKIQPECEKVKEAFEERMQRQDRIDATQEKTTTIQRDQLHEIKENCKILIQERELKEMPEECRQFLEEHKDEPIIREQLTDIREVCKRILSEGLRDHPMAEKCRELRDMTRQRQTEDRTNAEPTEDTKVTDQPAEEMPIAGELNEKTDDSDMTRKDEI